MQQVCTILDRLARHLRRLTCLEVNTMSKLHSIGRDSRRQAGDAVGSTGRRGRCHGDFALRERELAQAMDEYKRSSGRLFPTWSEVLEVIMGLGYRKRP